jgi:anti-sigma factor RsiW
MPDDEERLAALIDNELDEEEKAALIERLAQDETLRDRLAALRRDRDRLVASFDALLAQAPLDRLRAAVPAGNAKPPAPQRRGSIGWLELAAGIVLGLLLGGAASWIGFGAGAPGERDDWRQAVVEYMGLYTPDTFALAYPDSAAEAKQLQAVSARVGVDLTPDKVAVPGMRYRAAFNLAYDGAPLGEIAYTDAGGAPALFCVIANGKPDAPARTVVREGLSYVTWSRGGRDYMFVAHMPEQRVADLAQTLAGRF